jgi:hypothetical protein
MNIKGDLTVFFVIGILLIAVAIGFYIKGMG